MNNRHRRRRSDEERGPVSYALCAARVRTYLRIRPCARTYVQSALVPASKGHAPNVRTEHPRLRRLADRLRRQSHLVERACLRTYVREDACCLRVCPPSTRMSSSLLASVGSSCSCWICATIAWPCSRSLSKASLTTCLMLSSLDLRRIVLRLRFLFITYVHQLEALLQIHQTPPHWTMEAPHPLRPWASRHAWLIDPGWSPS